MAAQRILSTLISLKTRLLLNINVLKLKINHSLKMYSLNLFKFENIILFNINTAIIYLYIGKTMYNNVIRL